MGWSEIWDALDTDEGNGRDSKKALEDDPFTRETIAKLKKQRDKRKDPHVS